MHKCTSFWDSMPDIWSTHGRKEHWTVIEQITARKDASLAETVAVLYSCKQSWMQLCFNFVILLRYDLVWSLVLSLSNRDRDGVSIVKGKKCKSAVNSKPAGRRPRRHSVMHYFINFLPRLDWQDEMCIKPPRLDSRLAVAEKKSADCTRNSM